MDTRTMFFSHNWPCLDLFIVYICDTQTSLFRYKVWVSPRLAHTHTHTHACLQHSHHTQRDEQKYRWGRRRSRRPHRHFCSRARSARAPLCGVWMLAARVRVWASLGLTRTLYLNNMSVYRINTHWINLGMANRGWKIWFCHNLNMEKIQHNHTPHKRQRQLQLQFLDQSNITLS